jgi:hypothetical protein
MTGCPPAHPVYVIRVQGQLDPLWAGWFDGMTLTNLPEQDQAVIHGPVIDQSALHGILTRIRDLNLILISVYQEKEETQ